MDVGRKVWTRGFGKNVKERERERGFWFRERVRDER